MLSQAEPGEGRLGNKRPLILWFPHSGHHSQVQPVPGLPLSAADRPCCAGSTGRWSPLPHEAIATRNETSVEPKPRVSRPRRLVPTSPWALDKLVSSPSLLSKTRAILRLGCKENALCLTGLPQVSPAVPQANPGLASQRWSKDPSAAGPLWLLRSRPKWGCGLPSGGLRLGKDRSAPTSWRALP